MGYNMKQQKITPKNCKPMKNNKKRKIVAFLDFFYNENKKIHAKRNCAENH